jgi:choline dehydrogenase-like flavoprotein
MTKVDAAVIGSGASGSVMAYELARKGLSVTVLERGPREDPTTFEHDELSMFSRVYKQGGLQSTDDHDSIIVQGQAVGGSTVINNAIWMRAELDRVLPEWEERGAHVPRYALDDAYDELEGALHVGKVPRNMANKGSDVFLDGCAAIGIPGELLENNRFDCIGCGWCNYGCRYNRKTSMLVTYIPWAEAKGADVRAGCEDVRITSSNGRATGVEWRQGRHRESIEADRVVVCAGAVGSSEVLIKSGITSDGKVGQGLHALGGIFVTGETDEIIDGYDGIGLTCVAHADSDYVIESYFAPPVAFSLRLGGWFLSHFNRAERYRSFVDGGVMVGTNPQNGSVKVDRKGNVKIRLKVDDTDLEALKRGLKTLSRIYFAGGARRVYPSTFKLLEVVNDDDLDLIDRMITRPDDLLFGSAHPQGGNLMNEDPAYGVVGPDFGVHGKENLYVADTSVWPSNIRANCQATAMAMAHYAARSVSA